MTWQDILGPVCKRTEMDGGKLPPVKLLGTHVLMTYSEIRPEDQMPTPDKVDLEAGWIKSLVSKLKRHGNRHLRGSVTSIGLSCFWMFKTICLSRFFSFVCQQQILGGL